MRADDLALIYDVTRDMDLPALPLYADLYAGPVQTQAFIDSGWLGDTLVDTGWHRGDAMIFFAHLGREAIHASRDRQFSKAHWQTVCSTCRDVSRAIDPKGWTWRVFPVGDFEPPVQTRLRDPEITGHVSNRSVALSGNADYVFTELFWIRNRHNNIPPEHTKALNK